MWQYKRELNCQENRKVCDKCHSAHDVFKVKIMQIIIIRVKMGLWGCELMLRMIDSFMKKIVEMTENHLFFCLLMWSWTAIYNDLKVLLIIWYCIISSEIIISLLKLVSYLDLSSIIKENIYFFLRELMILIKSFHMFKRYKDVFFNRYLIYDNYH